MILINVDYKSPMLTSISICNMGQFLELEKTQNVLDQMSGKEMNNLDNSMLTQLLHSKNQNKELMIC